MKLKLPFFMKFYKDKRQQKIKQEEVKALNQ